MSQIDEPLEWTTVQVRVSDLVPHEHNPRKISDEQLAKLEASLRKFNLVEIPVVDHSRKRLLAGHQKTRVLLAAGRGDELIDVRVPNRELTEAEVKEYILISNTHAGEMDFEVLFQEFQEVDPDNFLFEIPGLEEWRAEQRKNSGEALEEDDEEWQNQVEEVETDIQPGDLLEIGRHRLICGDCTNVELVASLMEGAAPYLMITDPPYGVNYDPTWRHKAGVIDSDRVMNVANDDQADWTLAWELAPSKVAYVWHADRFASSVQSSLERCGFQIRAQIVWVKQQMVFGRGDYHWQHEPCWYAVKKGARGNYIGDRTQTTVWNITSILQSSKQNEEDEAQLHGTQKPVECMLRPIRNHSGDVYDPFLGSGTTMVACEKLQRRCYAMELSPQYCQITINRMRKLYPNLRVLRNGAEW